MWTIVMYIVLGLLCVVYVTWCVRVMVEDGDGREAERSAMEADQIAREKGELPYDYWKNGGG